MTETDLFALAFAAIIGIGNARFGFTALWIYALMKIAGLA